MLGLSESRIGRVSGAPPESFYIKTTKQTAFTITVTCAVYNTVTINWGDGSSTLVNNSTAKTKTYAEPGEHTVTLSGTLSRITTVICSNQQVTEVGFHSEAVNINSINYSTNSALIGQVTIPDTFTALRTLLFNNTSITGITIPTNLTVFTSINLTSCTNITEINYSHIVTCTNFYASTCTNLVTVYLNSLNTCSVFLFGSSTKLETLVHSISSNMSNFGIQSTKLTSVSCNTASISSYFYAYSCNSLTSISFPNLTTCATIAAFSCPVLSTIYVPSLQTVSSSMGVYLSGVTSLSLPSATFIKLLSAYSCPNLISIYCTASGKIDDFNAYSNNSLQTISCPNVTSSNNWRCYSNPVLQSMSAPNLTNSNYFDAYNTPNLTNLVISSFGGTTTYFRCYNSGIISLSLLNVSINTIECYSCPNLTSVSLPNLTTINIFSFHTCSNLTTLYAPVIYGYCRWFYLYGTSVSSFYLNITSCVEFMVYNNASITSIELPILTTITTFHFHTCPNLSSVLLPSVTGSSTNVIGYGSGISTITLNQSVVTNLQLNNCVNLNQVLIPNATAFGLTLWLSASPVHSMDFPNVINVNSIKFNRCGLSTAEVDAYLSKFKAIADFDGACACYLDNSGAEGILNDAPSAAGLADRLYLIGRGWSVYVAT